MKVRVEVLDELGKYGWGNGACSEDRRCLVSIVIFDTCHILEGRGCGGGSHSEAVV